MAHILLYTDDASAGGVAQYNHSVVMALAKAGHQVSRAAHEVSDPLAQAQAAAGIAQIQIPRYTSPQQTAANHEELRAFFKQHAPNLVLFSDSCPVVNLAAKQVARELGIPYIVVEGFVAPYLAQRFGMVVEQVEAVYRHARAVVAVSQENLELLHRLFGLPAGVGTVVHYGRPEAFFAPRDEAARRRLREEFSIPSEAIVAVTTARLTSLKGYELQIHALQRLKSTEAWKKLHFVWVGGGELEEKLRADLAAHGLADHVTFAGQRWNIPDFLDMADCYVLPTTFEGMPLAIMEAMAKGLPVAASAVSGIPEELGDAGLLLPDPNTQPQAAIEALAAVLTRWAEDAAARQALGQAARARAEKMFREELMLERTMRLVDAALLPASDYVTPGFAVVRPDAAFRHMIVADSSNHPWEHFRRSIPHTYYCDDRYTLIGFASRDEASILHNTALQFAGMDALEIGCWQGWSAAHLALAGVQLDVVDPLLEKPDHRAGVEESLRAAGVLERTRLVGGYSPAKVHELAKERPGKKWSLIFIDGEHGRPGPLNDAMACLQYAADDCAILFHDLASPEVAEGLDYLRQSGWKTRIYMTKQIMGIAWRGNVEPLPHVPDPRIRWPVPPHLMRHPISGISYSANQQQRSTSSFTVQGESIRLNLR